MRIGRRTIDIALVVLGVASLVCLSPVGSALAVIAAISVIGLPITLAMGAIPSLFLFLLLARLIHLMLAAAGLRFWPASALLSLGLLAAIPFVENRKLDAEAGTLIAKDIRTIGNRPASGTLAYVGRDNGKSATECGDFCRRALLNGAVDAVLVASSKSSGEIPADSLQGSLYRLERMATCPPVDIKEGERIEIPGEERQWGDKSSADLLRLEAAQGICLTKRDAALAEADAAIVAGSVKRGESPYTAGLSLSADTVSAERISYYVRENGALTERYRSTGVTYYRMLPLLLPSYVSGYGLKLAPGFLRSTAYAGDAKRYRAQPSLAAFVIETLGLDLGLRDEDASEATRAVVAAALAGPGPVDRANIKVMQDFFEEIHRRKDADEADAALALRILADRRVPVPRAASAPVRKFARDDPALAREFAAVLFDRLSEIDPAQREDDPDYLGYPLAYLAGAIAALPDGAILPYRSQLERLAHDSEARVRAYSALRRLSVFGSEAVSTLIFLIDDSWIQKKRDGNDWQHPYLAGIQGLCLLGSPGKAAIPMLYSRLEDGTVVKFASYWDLAINTLVSLGAEADEMWLYLQTDDRNHTRERFDSEVRRAQRKIDCSY